MDNKSDSTITPSPALTYFPYLNIVQNSVAVLCALMAISLNARLIYHGWVHQSKSSNQALKVRQLSKAMWFYLSVHLIGCVLTLPYNFYVVCNWRPAPLSPYDPYTLYWLGLPLIAYYTMSPVPILFLTIDRCLALKVRSRNDNQLREWIFLFGCAILFVAAMGSLTVNAAELPLDMDRVEGCQTFGCLVLKYRSQPQLLFKNMMELLNLLLALYFFRLLSSTSLAMEVSVSGARREILLKNRMVKCVLVLEIFFNVIPNITSYAINVMTGVSATIYLGQFPVTFLCINGALCGCFYNWMLLAKKKIPLSSKNAVAMTRRNNSYPQSHHMQASSSGMPQGAFNAVTSPDTPVRVLAWN